MEETPTGLSYWLARLKGLFAAVLPLYTVYKTATDDGAITSDEYRLIGEAFVFFMGVWFIPNLGYIRRLRNKAGELVRPGVEDTDQIPGKHEFEDRDQDGVSDAEELRANDRTSRLRGLPPSEPSSPYRERP